ncbi:hypothetical protein ABPG74_013133 [Tetrahymena malaccensis]
MNVLKLFIWLSSFTVFFTCLYEKKTQCFDQFTNAWQKIDGEKYIGRQKKNSFCVINSSIMDEIEFCFDKDSSICITKEKNKCVKINEDFQYVAIIQENNQCVSMNESISNYGIPQEMTMIKQGYCQRSDSQVVIGEVDISLSNYYLCLDQNNKYIENHQNHHYCLEKSTKQIKLLSKVAGRTMQGSCVSENEYYGQKVSCNIQFCELKNENNQFTCIAYDSHLVIGKTQLNQCIFDDSKLFDTQIQCKPQFCRQIQSNRSKCIKIINSQGILQNGDCIHGKQQLRKLLNPTSSGYGSYPSQCTSSQQCYDIGQYSCINLGSSNNSLAKLNNNYCATLNVRNSVSCYYSYPACLSSQGVCLQVSYSNSQSVGQRQGGQCAILNTVYQDLSSCSQSLCITQYGQLSNQFCSPFYGSSNMFMMFDCNNVSQKSQYCKDPSGQFCFDSSSKECFQTLTFGGTGAGCQYNGTCQILSNNQFIGRAQPNNQCLQNNQVPNTTLETCFYDPQNICKVISPTQFCVIYPSSSQYLGFVSENNGCAVLNQITFSLGYVANVINLRSNHCQDSNGYIIQLDYNQNIGVDSDRYQCLQLYQQPTGIVIECQRGFCVSSGCCQKYDSIMIGKNAQHQCLQERQPISIECSFDDIDVCFDTDAQACNHLNDSLPNSQGKISNGLCASGSKYYSKILKCSFNFCIQKRNPADPNSQEGCFPFDISQNRVGVDANGYCVKLDQQNAVRCMKGQVCLDNQNGYACTSLVFSKTLNKYARQQNTMFCLPYLDPSGLGDQIETCVLGSCLYQDFLSNQDYCVIQGTIAKGHFIVGVDIYQLCISEDQITSNQIVSCFGLTYCILPIGIGQQQKCQQLQDFDPYYPNMIYRAKNANQYCQDLNMPNSIGCMDGLYCINTQNNNQCQIMNDPSKLNLIGRDLTTQKCIPQQTPIASKCQTDFCILQGMCVPLSETYPGKEIKTHLCLQQSEIGQYGASNCYKDGYCIEADSDGYYSCNKLDFSNPNRIGYIFQFMRINSYFLLIGIEKDTQKCIQSNLPIAVMCAIERYCLNLATKMCQIIDLTQKMCVDTSGACAYDGACKTCDIDQCISPSQQNKCVNIFQPTVTYCIDQLGFCAALNSKKCFFCPDGYCNIYNNGNCINGTQLLDSLVGNSCFTQIKNQNNKCVQQSVDTLDSDGNALCLNSSGMCQQIIKKNSQCLVCPKYYINAGDDKCYSLEEISVTWPNLSQVYFNMLLTYVKQDCYDNQFCLNDNTKKCPQGCYLCSSQEFCTQCIQGYFLYKISPSQQSCILCNSDIGQYTQVSSFYQNIPIYTCLDCTAEYGLWNQTQSIYKTCQNYKVQYDQIFQIMENLLPATNFQVKQMSGQYQLEFYQPTQCTNYCFSCIQSSQNKVICAQCNVGYVLSHGKCQKCPNNCQSCQYATFMTGFAQLITEIKFDKNELSLYNFILICLECENRYMISFDLQSCLQCGAFCASCQYENEESVLNLNKQYLRRISYDQLIQLKYVQKCTQCQNGYFLSYDGKTCLKNLQNCDYSSQIAVYGSQSYDLTEQLWTYTMTPSLNKSIQICKQCSKNYIVSIDQTSCKLGCISYSQQSKCAKCSTDSSHNAVCQFCSKGSVLDNTNEETKCQDASCQINIYGCNECYSYLDIASTIFVYQCTQCKEQYTVPSINGCLKCPEGCSECYEGTRTFNYTSQLIYKRPYLNIQERLNYNSTKNYKLMCTKCQQGYQFDQQSKLCVKLNCGKYCLQCALINNKPQCIQCNYDLLSSLIKNQQYFIGTLYYYQRQSFDIKNMVSLTEAGNDCQLCPLMCETCINNEDISLNPFHLYDAQCFSCKNSLSSSKVLQDYRITYDKDRRKCYLCQKTEQGCFYKKQQTIYIQCLELNSRKGDGSFQNPINYNRLNEIDIDKVILNEIDYDQAIVFYNELQVKILEVQLIFLGDTCIEKRSQIFSTKLKDQIRSIETAVLKINAITSTPSIMMKFQQNNIFEISGFNQVQINNIQFVQQLSNSQLGLIVSDIDLNLFKVSNCQFSQLQPLKNYLILEQFLTLQLQTLEKANLEFEQVQFQNLYISNNQQLIQTKFNQVIDSSMNLTLSSVTFIDVYFDFSSIIQLNTISIQLQIQNLTFLLSTFDNRSVVFDIQPNQISSQEIDILIVNMTVQQSQILFGSQIINSNYLSTMVIKNMTFIQNTLSQMQNQVIPLLIANTYKLKGLNFIQNTIINYSLFQQQDSLLVSKQSLTDSTFEDITISDNKFSSIDYSFFHYQTSVNSNTQINGMKILRNQFPTAQTQIFIQLENINTVQISDVQMQDNFLFLFLQVKSAVNVLITKIVQTQTQNDLMSPQICQLNQILNYVNIDTIQQQNINISKNMIYIETSQVCLNTNQFTNNNQFPQGIFISNIISNQVSLYYSQNAQSTSPFSIFSKQDINVLISNLNFSNYSAVIQTNQKPLGQISLGFYFKAPTIRAIFIRSNFTNLGNNNPFNWIQGQVKQIEFNYCQFDNEIIFSDQHYQGFKTQKKGGFITIKGEYLTINSSRFSNGFSLNGGSLYWISQSLAKLYIQNTTFYNNVAYSVDDLEAQGGALFINGQQSFSLSVFIYQSIFKSNFASFKGGAIQIVSTITPRSVIIIQEVQFNNNYSLQGSNLNVESSIITKAAVILKNIISQCQIEILAKQFQNLSSILSNLNQISNSHSSLFVVLNSYEISIENSLFQITCQNIAQTNLNFVNDFIFQKAVFVLNAQQYTEYNNTYSQSVFLNNLINVTQATFISISSNRIINNININNLISLQNQSNLIQNLAFYNSQICSLTLVNIKNNNCNSCSKGIIEIISQGLEIQNSNFENNVAQYGAGFYFRQNKNSQKIQEITTLVKKCIFKNNKALISGGSIFINYSLLIINKSVFQNNNALSFGGAIYIQNDSIMSNQLQLQDNYFIENQSQFGGAIASSTGQSVNQFSNNTYIQNKASKYGQNIQTSPTSLNVYINNNLKQINQNSQNQINIQNHQGGYLNEDIVLKFNSRYFEEINVISDDIQLDIKILSGQGFINTNKISQQNGLFNLTEQLQIYGILGQELLLQITSDQIQIPKYNISNFIINYDRNYKLILKIQFSTICPVGEVKKQIYDKFNYCLACIDSYSFTNSDVCFQCPNSEVKCSGNKIYLTSNYWRVNQQSSQLYKCKNCIGDYNLNENEKQIMNQRLIVNDLNYYCQKGYIGALCEDCDITGQYWGTSYYMSLNKSCQQCSDIKILDILYPLCLTLIAVLFILSLTHSYSKQVKKNLLYKTCSAIFKEKIFWVRLNSVNTAKILVSQLFVLGLIFYYDQSFPTFLSPILVDLGNLFVSQIRILECLLIQITQSNFFINNLLFYFSYWFAVFLCLIFACFLKKYLFKQEFWTQELVLGVLIFIYNSQFTILNKLFRQIKCQTFDNQSFVTDHLSYYCDEFQFKFFDYVLSALYSLVLLLPQGFLLLQLYKKHYLLNNYQSKLVYGYFTEGYKFKFYYWDLVKLTYKIILGIIANFSYQIRSLQPVLSVIVSILYTFPLHLCQPYESNKLNRIEFNIQNITSVLFCLVNLDLSDNYIIYCVIFGIKIILISGIFYQILKTNQNLKNQYMRFIQKLQQNSRICFLIINKLKLNSPLIKYQKCQKNWKKINKIIFAKSMVEFSRIGQIEFQKKLKHFYKIQKLANTQSYLSQNTASNFTGTKNII